MDETRCANPFNELARFFNRKLKDLVDQLCKELGEATITYVDIYRARYTLISQASKHGFEHPLRACCGYGGKYNYNIHVGCGGKVSDNGKELLVGSCKDPSVKIIWDGIHYTEAANKWVFDHSTGSSNPQNKEGNTAFDEKEHDAEKPESAVNLSPSRSALSGENYNMSKKKDNGKSPVECFLKYRDLNTVFEYFSEDSSNDVSAVGPIVPTAGQNYSHSTNPISATGPIVNADGHNYSNSTNPISAAGSLNSNSSLTHGQSSLRDTYQPPDMV
nr:GDSL esterase/lipase At3g26430-like [Tanacetum cinerariifolium]